MSELAKLSDRERYLAEIKRLEKEIAQARKEAEQKIDALVQKYETALRNWAQNQNDANKVLMEFAKQMLEEAKADNERRIDAALKDLREQLAFSQQQLEKLLAHAMEMEVRGAAVPHTGSRVTQDVKGEQHAKKRKNNSRTPQQASTQKKKTTPHSKVSKKRRQKSPVHHVTPPDTNLKGEQDKPTVWRVEISVPRGVTMRNLRKKVVELAQTYVGYDGTFEYPKTGDIYTNDTPFVSVVYFGSRSEAGRFRNAVEEKGLKPRGLSFKDCTLEVSQENRELERAVLLSSHYDPNDSPDRSGLDSMDIPASITESLHSTVKPERKLRESLAYDGFDYEDAHIIEKAVCVANGLTLLNNDLSNRLVLPGGLVHKMYDGRHPEFVGPGLSFYCDQNFTEAPPRELVPVQVTMHVFFHQWIEKVMRTMREPIRQCGDKIVFEIMHPDPNRFKVLLNVRYSRDSTCLGVKPRGYTEAELKDILSVCDANDRERNERESSGERSGESKGESSGESKGESSSGNSNDTSS